MKCHIFSILLFIYLSNRSMRTFILLLYFILSVCGLNSYLKRFDPINYRTSDLARIRRSKSNEENEIRMKFEAMNRTFSIVLHPLPPQKSAFQPDAIIEVDDESIALDRGANMYEGYLDGEEDSHVFGSIHDGIFEGSIVSSTGKEYTIESSSRYDHNAPFHSFIYDNEDVDLNLRNSHNPLLKHSENITFCSVDSSYNSPSMKSEDYYDNQEIHSRFRRGRPVKFNNKTGFYSYRTCTIYVQVDHTLYNFYLKKSRNVKSNAYQEISSLVENQIKQINSIYQTTSFGGVLGINFAVAKLKVFTSANEPNYPYGDENMDPQNTLEKNAFLNHSQYCLAYVMSYRDYSQGTLGLAYVGTVCSVYQSNAKTQRSRNTGIVTFVNNGNTVPMHASHLTLAHEVGHNFGSSHDTSNDCTPEGKDGKFIMYYSSNSGKDPNNKKFSRCSINNITTVITKIMRVRPGKPDKDGVFNCFVDAMEAICGNGWIEPGEECDCGYDAEQCKSMGDECCEPASKGVKGCKLKSTATCSQQQGPCCDPKSCTFASTTVQCAEKGECAAKSMCNGTSPICPIADPIREGKDCDDYTSVCNSGSCNGSVCESMGYRDCKSINSCYLHCEINGKCVSSDTVAAFLPLKQKGRLGQNGLYMKPGSQCNNDRGICDVFLRCREVNAQGGIFSIFEKSIQQMKSAWDYVKEKWWVLALGIVGVIILQALFIFLCGQSTKSRYLKEKKKKKAKERDGEMDECGGWFNRKKGKRPKASEDIEKGPKKNKKRNDTVNRKKKIDMKAFESSTTNDNVNRIPNNLPSIQHTSPSPSKLKKRGSKSPVPPDIGPVVTIADEQKSLKIQSIIEPKKEEDVKVHNQSKINENDKKEEEIKIKTKTAEDQGGE